MESRTGLSRGMEAYETRRKACRAQSGLQTSKHVSSKSTRPREGGPRVSLSRMASDTGGTIGEFSGRIGVGLT